MVKKPGPTFERFRYEVCGGLVLLDVVPLHDSALLVEAQVPGPARGLLPVQHGGVGHVVVLKYRLLELTLRGKMFLRGKTTDIRMQDERRRTRR